VEGTLLTDPSHNEVWTLGIFVVVSLCQLWSSVNLAQGKIAFSKCQHTFGRLLYKLVYLVVLEAGEMADQNLVGSIYK